MAAFDDLPQTTRQYLQMLRLRIQFLGTGRSLLRRCRVFLGRLLDPCHCPAHLLDCPALL